MANRAERRPAAADPVAILNGNGNGNGGAVGTVDADLDARLDRIEAVQRRLVAAAQDKEAARVRRKVVASTTGAGAAGFVPLLLELADALAVSAQVAATIATAMAAVGALLAGYLTPERGPAPAPGEGTLAPR
jgi:hypothetical protein